MPRYQREQRDHSWHHRERRAQPLRPRGPPGEGREDPVRLPALPRASPGDLRRLPPRRSHIAQYLDRRSAKIAGNGEIACLSSVFKCAIRWGWCDENPCRGAARNPERRRVRLPSDAELAAIRVAASEQLRCIVDLVLLIGLRKGDMLKIRLPDLTPQGLRVEVQKTGAVAVFEWSEALREVIDRARSLRRRVGTLYLFATRSGQRYATNGFDSIWRRTLKRAGVEGLTFHDLRRWAINQAQRQGGLDYAQAIGVHQSRQSTEGYLVPGEIVVRPLK